MILRCILVKILHRIDDLRAVLYLVKNNEGLFWHNLLTTCQYEILQNPVYIFCGFKELLVFFVFIKVEMIRRFSMKKLSAEYRDLCAMRICLQWVRYLLMVWK